MQRDQDRGRAYSGKRYKSFDQGRIQMGPSDREERADYSNYNESLRGRERAEEKSYFGQGPKNWKRSDERIKEEVCERLWRDSQIDASDIEVDVQKGCVYLRGLVDSRDTKRSAEYRIEDISGVEDVQNELRIQHFGKENYL